MLPWMTRWCWGTGSRLSALAKQPCAPEIAKAPDEYRTMEPNTGSRRAAHRRLGDVCGLIAAEPSSDHTLVNSFEPCVQGAIAWPSRRQADDSRAFWSLSCAVAHLAGLGGLLLGGSSLMRILPVGLIHMEISNLIQWISDEAGGNALRAY
jgi:hypothetical protein